MSVYRQDLIEAEGGPIRRIMVGHEGYALASLTAGQVRSKDQTVHPDPLPEESSHTLGPKSFVFWGLRGIVWVKNADFEPSRRPLPRVRPQLRPARMA